MAARTPKPWYRDVAAVMIRERMPLRAALSVLGIAVPSAEVDQIEHSAAMLKALDEQQAIFFQELATSPTFNKDTLVGGMLHAVNQLLREGSYEKAVEAWFKLARVKDWVGADSNINVMLGVDQKDIERAREALAETRVQ